MRVLVTGGCGFVGSHQVVSLIESGHEVFIVDDLSNSSEKVVERIEQISGTRPDFIKANILDQNLMFEALVYSQAEAIIHFAGLKHVNESLTRVIDYYETNVAGLISILNAANKVGVKKFVFSSSGSVYGETDQLPIKETQPHKPSNPYSQTKSICEQILKDQCMADKDLAVASLRYFNPAGAHPSGLIGEDPTGLLTNLLPVLMHVAVGNIEEFTVNGTDFDTPDSTAVRDYIHVCDVATQHLNALTYLASNPGFTALNIGRGEGVSVLQMLEAVKKSSGINIEYKTAERRQGDVSALYADNSLANELLGQTDYKNLETICDDAWHWQSKNPTGYK